MRISDWSSDVCSSDLQDHNLLAHRIRWGQQHNRLAGLIERDDGNWRLTSKGSSHLTQAFPGRPITIFITPNGCALWGLAEEAASVLDHGTIRLLPTSPPYTRTSVGQGESEIVRVILGDCHSLKKKKTK